MTPLLRQLLRRLTPGEVAAKELADAQLELLEARTGEEYATAMVSYHTTRIKRLHAYLASLKKEQ